MKRIPSAVWTLAAVLALFTSCGDQPTEPFGTPSFSNNGNGNGKGNGATRNALGQQKRAENDPAPTNTAPITYYKSFFDRPVPGQIQKVIGREGGSLRLGDFEIIVPPGAVASPTRFSIDLPQGLAAWKVYARFGPHRTFNQPVTVRLPYDNTLSDGSQACILWWNGNAWKDFPTTLTDDGRLETTTEHFSYYGTSVPVKKGVTGLGG